MTHTILLFDMDGVIIQSKGYYRGLQAAIKLLGQNLGIANTDVSMDYIAKVEACGIYHIWDHMTIFSALVLTHIWQIFPDARIPKTLCSKPTGFKNLPAVDFNQFTKKIERNRTYSMAEIEDTLISGLVNLNASQKRYIHLLFQTSQDIYKSPVLPIMQEYALGSDLFSQSYHLPSQLNIQSYPQRYDLPSLSDENYNQFFSWLESKYHHAAIFTNRPSIPPEDFFGTPEAEIGAAIIGMQDIPMVGAGSMAWLADIDSNPVIRYNKPHPVHALAAMQSAVGQPLVRALHLAVDLASKGQAEAMHWQNLDGAKIYVFEDSQGGLISAREACQLLANAGIATDVQLIGISAQEDKITSLLEITDQIFSDINISPLKEIIYSRS